MVSSNNHVASVGRPRHSRGFTLIEVMIVVLVIAVLAAIAYPNYENAVLKSKRGQVKGDLVELAQRYERWHTMNNTYAGFWASLPAAQKVSPRDASGAAVTYNIGSVEAANTFTLTATPQNRQIRDTRCGTLTLNQAGAKTKAPSASGTLAECW